MMARTMIMIAGIAGALGVGLSAAAAHRGSGNLGTAAQFLLVHASAFLAIAATARRDSRLRIGAGLMVAGVLLFCGDLAMRDLAGTRLFAMAAPAGGISMIAGWVLVGLSALSRGEGPKPPNA